MKTNSIYKTSLLAAALLLAATSCVKDELHDTPHPDTGKITVTADWTDRGEGVELPAEWTVTMGRPMRRITSLNRATTPLRPTTSPRT